MWFKPSVYCKYRVWNVDILITVCRVLSCSSDSILFGSSVDTGVWSETIEKIQQIDVQYQDCTEKILQGLIEAIAKK